MRQTLFARAGRAARRSSFFARIVGTLALAFALMTPAAHAQNYSDIWWNPDESGWGLTIADHDSQLFAVWFTYRQDGSPTWYVIPGGTLSTDHLHFQGDLYTTTGPAYSSAPFDPSRVTITKVGTAALDFTSSSTASFTYSVGSVTATKPIQRQPFGNGAPTWGSDLTDIWWNPAQSGWGMTLAQHGNNAFGVWFTYDTNNRPLWVVMPGVTFNGPDAFTGALYTTTGPYFGNASFDPSQVVVTPAGSASATVTRSGNTNTQCAGAQSANLTWTLRNVNGSSPICEQPFGAAPPSSFAPVDFPDAPGLLEGAALFNAPANPLNVSITSDDSKAVTQVVPATGASIGMTDAKGNRFTLDVPAGALFTDTAITMTPIATLTGVSYASGIVAGVKFEPDGLMLQKSATLTIVPAVPFPVQQQTPFSAKASGNDMVYAVPTRDLSRIQVAVPHFSWWGWLLMSSQERTDQMRMKLASENADRLQQWAAEHLMGERRLQVLGVNDEAPPSINQVTAWFEAYHTQVIGPMLQSLANNPNCLDALKALDAINYVQAITSTLILDLYPGYEGDKAKVEDALMTIHDHHRACYYEQVADLTVTDPKRTMKAHVTATWYVKGISGDVYDYKLVSGKAVVYIPDSKECTITTPPVRLDPSKAHLTVDFGAQSYHGQAGPQMAPVHISCKGNPPIEDNTIFPVLYLGLFGEATGPINYQGEIHQPVPQSIPGKMDLTWHFYTCSAGNGSNIFCTGHATTP